MFAIGIVAAGVLALSVAGLVRYTGSKALFAAFCAAYLALAVVAFPKPRQYVFLFFAGFLCLGFWLKAIAHFAWNVDFVEPIGDFTRKPDDWDSALLLATAGALGALAAKGGHLWIARRRAAGATTEAEAAAPAWFIALRRPIWLLTLALIIALNALNFVFAFYQVGVNPKLILPLRLHIPAAWLINSGFALWLAALVYWDLRAGKGFVGGLMAAMLEALLSSLSAHSRFFFLLHAGPYWLVGAERWQAVRGALRRMAVPVLFASFILLLALSLAVISRIRFQEYFDMPKLPAGHTEARYYREVVERQLTRLLVQRWVGLEGALIATAAPGRGYDLASAAASDSPRHGADALYQKAAKVPYASSDPRFTFLTNAGPVALLGLSGSIMAVFLGMALLVAILIATEHLAQQLTGNPFFVAVAGASLANVASQMTFPYLSLVFLLQLWVATAFLAFVQRTRFGFQPAS
jgi:hypothetical protein